MTDKIDPSDAARMALGETGDETPRMGEPAGGGGGGPVDRLFDGDAPGPQVPELTSEYGMPRWMAMAARGILRTATGSGVPPIFEILVGSVMGIMQNSDGFGDGDDSGDFSGEIEVAE